MPPPAQVVAVKVAAKAAKRAARQSAGGLPAGAEELEALGWAPVDDDVRAVFAAAEAGGRRAEGGAAAAGGDFTARGGWRTVEADAAALLTGATEYGFVSLEARAPLETSERLPFGATREPFLSVGLRRRRLQPRNGWLTRRRAAAGA